MTTEMKHQTKSLKFMAPKKCVFDMSDPGTGKTYVAIKDFARQHKKDKKAMMVFCPKSLMQAAWANDIKKFAPHLRVSIAWAKDRHDALAVPADVYIINVDGVKDLLKYAKSFWKKFGRIIFDESTAFKHHTSARSKAALKIVKNFEWRRCLSGTPTSNGICDLWHQVLLLDDGARLGKSFFQFRSACCVPEAMGKPMLITQKNRAGEIIRDENGDPVKKNISHVRWIDREGIELQIGVLISDITIRHKFEDCVDIPAMNIYSMPTYLSPKHRKLYDKLEEDSIVILEDTAITAVNKAVLLGKLLQCVSGAIYNNDGGYTLVDTDRYELVMDLVEERRHSLVFYTWDHQLQELLSLAKKRGVSHVVWNPDRPVIEAEFQSGQYQVLFAHPQSAGHGLTLTRATANIWPSPTYNLEHFRQGLKRVHRIGQRQKTETIVIVAEDSRDENAWEALQYKGKNMDALLGELA